MKNVTVRRDTPYHINGYHLQVEGEGDSVPRCNLVRQFLVDIVYRLA
jgi:hypothetical protein